MTRLALLLALTLTPVLLAQKPQIEWSDREKPIYDQIRTLRKVPDDQRGAVTRRLATEIRALPAGRNKLRLAQALANLSTEGDFGRDTLQEVAVTLAQVVREEPAGSPSTEPSDSYMELATLVRYEGVHLSISDPQFAAAMAKLEAADRKRASADFALADLQGRRWQLKDLRGKVVLVNFWATWCPPCRKEMPDLEALYDRFKDRGLVILAISDEDADKVKPFLADKNYTYPVLLDPGRKANEAFDVEGIPKSFVFDRKGALVAQAIDMRTRSQFLAMLAKAGLTEP